MDSDLNPQSGFANRLSTRIYGRFVRKGLEGREAVTPHSGGTEPPQSPVFYGAKNAPK
jgi:hypothetical protein